MQSCGALQLLRFMLVCCLAVLSAGCASTITVPRPIVKWEVSAVPFEKQVEMGEGDAYEIRLPDGKTVAVWCERLRPEMLSTIGEQRTASGLKTAWGERPFKHPEPIWKSIGTNSYTLSGWESYISQGPVTTNGDETSDYEIYVGDLQINIIEHLQGKPSLPVTIRVTRK